MAGQLNEPIVLNRDVDAVLIPAGDHGTIPSGTLVHLTQALGGSFTVFCGGNLFRIDGKDADALGKEIVKTPEVPDNPSDEQISEVVQEQLKTCYDPEIPINIVDLGLVYDCEIQRDMNGRFAVYIKMTLTAPGCGMGDFIAGDVRDKLLAIPMVDHAEVELVFDPPWDREMMSEEARLQTGLM